MTRESKFYKALRDIFIGAKVEGKSGYINLMRIKSRYFEKGVFPKLQMDIEEALKPFPNFKEELFEKLYTFFHRYFSESGSIYFRYTPIHQNIYEKVYTDDKDVILFWKTHMLYYVKTDRLFKNLEVEVENSKFFFDVSQLEHKKAFEKKSVIYNFKEKKKNGRLVFDVSYTEKGKKTKIIEILKALNKEGVKITEDILEKAFRIFEKQSEVDYFINKNAKEFLREQFNIWLYQYVFSGESEWTEERIKQLQILKDIAFKIIDFISQFEDELVKIWNKPKFVLNSNYVITLDRIVSACHSELGSESFKLVNKILNHKNFDKQIKEWQNIGIVDKDFNPKDVIANEVKQSQIFNKKFQYLPIDTKYFKDLELDILELFDNLDESIDGWLIKSENYQALNTILPKFKEKVQMIFIDPPFNKAESDQFLYTANYLDSSWITLLENRLKLAKEILTSRGTIFVNSDDKCNTYTKFLLDQIFTNFQNEIIWCYEKPGAGSGKFKNNHANIYFVDYEGKISPDWWVDMWTDIPSFATAMTAGERTVKMLGIQFPTQLPEKLLYRVIRTGSNDKDIVMDFFAGTGVLAAVAQKTSRKWISVELGEQFNTIILPRMKKVLAYDKSGISKEIKEYQGGGFFKYYELEQYENTLRKAKYEDSDLFDNPYEDPYNQYVFMKDLKMSDALEVDYKNNKVKVDLSKLHKNIDIPETLSNLLGKNIKKITEGEVEFEDGEKIDINDLDYNMIKPLIWW